RLRGAVRLPGKRRFRISYRSDPERRWGMDAARIDAGSVHVRLLPGPNPRLTASDREKEEDSMFHLSVCAETLFRELPLAQRAREIARAGFRVEFWAWKDRGLEAIAADPEIHISAFPGYNGGSIVHPDGVPAFPDGVRKSLAFAEKVGCRQLFISTGEI